LIVNKTSLPPPLITVHSECTRALYVANVLVHMRRRIQGDIRQGAGEEDTCMCHMRRRIQSDIRQGAGEEDTCMCHMRRRIQSDIR